MDSDSLKGDMGLGMGIQLVLGELEEML